jgi:hypothetical protein
MQPGRSDNIMKRDAERFDAFLASLDEEERYEWKRWIEYVQKLFKLGEMGAKHLIMQLVYFEEENDVERKNHNRTVFRRKILLH